MTLVLPQEFLDKYQKLLGDDFDDFLATFGQKVTSGYRVNPLKNLQQEWTVKRTQAYPWGYQGKISGRSVEFITGQVYSQEPSAQMVGKIAAPKPGSRVLDLCAAPGGKTTHLLSYLSNTGLLVANDVSVKRAKILVENLERFGARNVVTLNESPQTLVKTFGQYFDLIVVDAPCSGEGMFRKDPEAIQYWSQAYVERCALRQKDILAQAVQMLVPGGQLIYATCTWSPEEDEHIVDWLTRTYPHLSLQVQEKFWPHHYPGEGQFVAQLKDNRAGEESSGKLRQSKKTNLSPDQTRHWVAFEDQHLKIQLNGDLQTFGDSLYLLPEGLPDLKGLKIARNGLHLGTFKKNRFEPSFALGMALSPSEVKRKVVLNERELGQYLSGHPISRKETTTPKGWVQVVADHNGLGFAKLVAGTVKNYYPKGLRRRGSDPIQDERMGEEIK